MHDIDFDLHGLVGIRLVGATDRETTAVTRQLGPLRSSLKREPDIVIRFADRLPLENSVRFLGINDAGYTSRDFIVFRGRFGSPVAAVIEFEDLGRSVHVVCKRGSRAVPLLIPLINLTALSKGVLPLHASAFSYAGTGIVTTGWSKGGKTEALLAFAAHGARYVGDEWVYVSRDANTVFGIPEPIRLWEWHLRSMPELRERIALGDLARLRALSAVQAVERLVPGIYESTIPPARALARVLPIVKRQSHVDVHPEQLFGGELGTLSAPFERLFFISSEDVPSVTIEEVDPNDVAARMVFSLQHERLDFMSFYLKYRFAFPARTSAVVDEAEETQRILLVQAFAGKPTYLVRHPYPVAIPALYQAMRPYCEG